MRIVDPEFPQSSAVLGGCTRPPTPVTETLPFSPQVAVAPKASMHLSVDAQSAPVEKLVK
jgi:hypothetical protein